MLKKIFLTLTLTILLLNSSIIYSADTTSYTTMGVVDYGTFNEYKYKITDQYIDLRNKFEVTGKIDSTISGRILTFAEQGYKYLPNDLINKNYFNYLKTAIEKGQLYPENSSYFQDIATKIEDYLEKTSIQSIKGSIETIPSSGNAPLTVTLRGDVVDPTGTKLENYNYTWWMNVGGKRVVLGNKVALNYVFREEGNFTVFLDVTSNHKNSSGNVDVLPFSSRAEIEVKEKVASIVLKVNSMNLGNQDEIKFLPDEARYGLLFDASSSTPTSGTQFIRTEWDFGNGVKRSYDGAPQIERVVFASEGDYTVKLTLKTNAGKSVEKKFTVRIHQPIATINASATEGYMGDKFTFSTTTNTTQTNITYAWRIIDINNDTELLAKNSSTFTYTFTKKGRYNVQLFVTEPSGDTDYDSKIVYINSRAPEAKLSYSIPNQNKPNTIFLDASSSYDSDYSDDGKLTFSWQIDGQTVNLLNPNYNGSNGYYTFSSLGDHSVTVTVTDPDNMSSIKAEKINVSSLLSVDFNAFPRVSQVDKTIRFIADSSKAQYFEWDFGDGTKKGETSDTTTHSFKKSGIFQVKLRVVDENDKENTFSKNVFIGDADRPYPFITITDNKQNEVTYKTDQCDGEPAYVLNRVDTYNISGSESLDVTGNNTGLSFSWKIGNFLYSSQSIQKKFEDLGCQKLRLTVTSDKTGKSSNQDVYIKVENLKPVIGSLDLNIKDINADPVVVTVTAQGAKDEDGVIQSYLWYYYTDTDHEPQDFRSTRTNQTTFVLPKITGNYYFAVVMKDNNEARVNSEDVNNSKYFVTLTGDNVNTPLLGLSVNNNSVALGDEVVFTADVENILGQSLNNVSSFSWDFDGDGFYDTETTTNTTTYKYKKSGEMYAKVRVKYKGYSNTKTVTMNVANILKADFDYVSIGSKFVFFDNSLSNGATYEWDMGDGNKVTTNKSFSYTYKDSASSHNVKLKLTEGTKINESTKKVVKNLPNLLKTNKQAITVYSNFSIGDDDTITLDDNTKSVYMYMTSNLEDVLYYVADYNINYDSDLNGGNDDDENNKFDDSYTTGNPILIEIDTSKQQIVRLYLKNSKNEVIASKDIKIVKNYIEEEVDVNSIIFEGVSDSTKLKLEKIKQAVDKFPEEYRLTGTTYIQKLKEEWNDDREKTNLIIEFESFIGESTISNGAEIIDMLESLLVEGESDKSEKSIAYNALKNLIPKSIQCVGDTVSQLTGTATCYDLLIEKLDLINGNSNVDENRVIGLEILSNVAQDESMTVKEKLDFKAILNTFVYGSLANVPQDNIDDVIQNEPVEKTDSKIISVLVAFVKLVGFALSIIAGIILAFFIYYKVTNKNSEIGFTDFIALKTGGKKSGNSNDNGSADLEDVLGSDINILSEKEEKVEKTESKLEKKEENKEENKEIEPVKEDKSQVPDWLKGSFSEDLVGDTDDNTQLEKESEQTETLNEAEAVSPQVTQTNVANEQTGTVPEWLKGSFSEEFNGEEETNNNYVPTEAQEESVSSTNEDSQESNDKEETIQENNAGTVPEWLKGSFSDDTEETSNGTVNTEEDTSESKATEESNINTKEELDNLTKLEEDQEVPEEPLPEWLKGTFANDGVFSNSDDDNSEEDDEDEEENEEDKIEEVKTEESKPAEVKKKRRRRKKSKPKTEPENTEKDQSKIEEDKTNSEEDKTQQATAGSIPELDLAPDTELWDDGMKVPDWLKTDDDKNDKKDEK